MELGAVACICNPRGPTGRWGRTGQRQETPQNSHLLTQGSDEQQRDAASNKMDGQGRTPEGVLQPPCAQRGMCVAALVNQCSYTRRHTLTHIQSVHNRAILIQSLASVFSRCDKGYSLTGDEESACLASGSWSHSSAVCELVRCSQPESIDNGKYILSGLTYLSIASYSCENGYR